MSLLKILKFPDPMLKKSADDVILFNEEISNLIDDLIETMFYYDALGIAATQVNIKKKIIIINLSNNYIKQPFVLINPKIFFFKKEILCEEGCLSFPNIFLKIKRHKNIFIKYFDINGILHFLKADNMLSICLQHEIDHINGITMYDKVNNIKKRIILRNII